MTSVVSRAPAGQRAWRKPAPACWLRCFRGRGSRDLRRGAGRRAPPLQAGAAPHITSSRSICAAFSRCKIPCMPNTNFADRLQDEMKRKQSRLIVGLDPVWDSLPVTCATQAQAEFGWRPVSGPEPGRCASSASGSSRHVRRSPPPSNRSWPSSSAGAVSALDVLERMLEDHSELFILDCKRGDIGRPAKPTRNPTSATRRAAGAAAGHRGHAERLSGPRRASRLSRSYFTEGKGAFALVKTSNPFRRTSRIC